MATTLRLTGDSAADKLLTEDPFALLTGLLLDQQYPMEQAFLGPQKIAERMSGFDIAAIANHDLDDFVQLCVAKPAIHRYAASMARRVHTLANYIMENYDGKTENLWESGSPDGKELLRRVQALPGYGEQKAKILLALLGKQRGVTPNGWRAAAGSYGEQDSRRSIADVTGPESLQEVRDFKKAAKAAAKKS